MESIELLILDVDGVLTDGGMYLMDDGRLLKRFSFLDGAGIVLATRAGLRIAICSGHDWAGSRLRFERLGLDPENVHLGVRDKGPVVEELTARHGLQPKQVAAMGDDLFDLPMFRRAGWKAAPRGAHPEILARADHVTERPAGQGAVREVIDRLLKARGLYRALIEELDS